ncbi:MAG: Uncharacterised protein [Flavobacterium sp. SCGC AAA160-P02]|nr:MAG: Uncharacterised protein [Flavobacterium sp. SCGC AAA160-P02]
MKKGIVFIVLFCFVITSSYGQEKKYISYSVKKGETIKLIAKRLGIKTKDLLQLNPDVLRKPAPETVIIIPNHKLQQQPLIDDAILEEIDSIGTVNTTNIDELKETFIIHKVVTGDTFYSLTRFYNVSEKEIRYLNPVLENEGLQPEMFLKIKPIEDENKVLIYRDSIQENASVKLAMMLPFRAIEYDTIDGKDIFKTNKLANITTDLYLGALVALDSLRSLGISLELSVFDTGRKNTKLDSIVSFTDFSEIDAIIGPLYSEEVPKVANKVSVPIVFPVYSKKQSFFKSPKISKTYADRDFHQKELVDYIFSSYNNENILIIGDSTLASIKNSDLIKSILIQHDSITEPQIIHPSQGYIKKHFIINALKPDIGNWVIVATDDNVITSDVVNSLISLPTEEPEEEEEDQEEQDSKEKDENEEPEMQILPEDTIIKLFGFFKYNRFDKIDNNKLAKLGFTYTTDVYTDENSSAIQIFNKQYVEMNYAYPSYYATKGFDIVFDTAMRLASGNEFKDTFNKGASYRIESKFKYINKLFESSSNNGIYILQYNPDLTIKRIK